MTVRSLALALLLAACASGESDRAGRVLLVAPPGTDVSGMTADAVARVEVAATPEARETGLMFREGLDTDSGMLFIYPDSRKRWFWMMNTKLPLSIAYADEGGRIVRILDMEPGIGRTESEQPRYPSDAPAMYALEMRRGWFRSKGISEGDRLHLHPVIAAVTPR